MNLFVQTLRIEEPYDRALICLASFNAEAVSAVSHACRNSRSAKKTKNSILFSRVRKLLPQTDIPTAASTKNTGHFEFDNASPTSRRIIHRNSSSSARFAGRADGRDERVSGQRLRVGCGIVRCAGIPLLDTHSGAR